MTGLSGGVAVVTGAASGIGLACARRFAAEGMRVVLADVEESALRAAEAELGATTETLTVVTDVSDPAAVDALADAAWDRFGGGDVALLAAGVGGGGGHAWEIELADWEWTLSVNLWGVIHGVRSFVPRFLEQGRGHLVNIASGAGLAAPPFMAPYDASKHAVVGISEAILHELATLGADVHVSVVCPNFVRTRIHESGRNRPARYGGPYSLDDPGEQSEAALAFAAFVTALVEGGIPPEDVADAIVDAVRERRFWVLTHAAGFAMARERYESIVEGRDPANPRV